MDGLQNCLVWIQMENCKNFSIEIHCRLLYQRRCDFNTLIPSRRLFQQFLSKIFVKVESERISFLKQNQSKLRASDYTHLCELLDDATMNTNEVQAWTKTTSENSGEEIGRPVVFLGHTLAVIRTCGRKCMILSPFQVVLVILTSSKL